MTGKRWTIHQNIGYLRGGEDETTSSSLRFVICYNVRMTECKNRIEILPIEQGATTDLGNINKHSQRGGTLLENSLRKRGAFRSIASAGKGVDIPVTYAGNYTLEKAVEAGFKEIVNVHVRGDQLVNVVRDDVAPGSVEAIALGLEDNESANQSYNPDIDMLAALAAGDNAILAQLRKEDSIFGGMLEGMGLRDETQDAEPDFDRAEELLEKWGVKSGDLFQIGDHKLLCGDCTKQEDVERVMGGEKAQFIFTDPPYGTDYKYKGYKDKREGYWDWMKQAFWLVNSALDIDTAIYIKQYTYNLFDYYEIVPKNWKYKNLIIWKNNSQSHPKGNYDNAFEIIFEFGTGENDLTAILFYEVGDPNFKAGAEKRLVVWDGKEKLDIPVRKGKMWNIWDDIKPLPGGFMRSKESLSNGGAKSHSCQMPLDLPMRAMRFSSHTGAIVFDPFCGSGTTIVACENLKRKCRAIEIVPAYVAVCLQRMQDAFPGIEIKRL